jgi:tetratricopeptide (TPR) repeat protein
MNPQLLRTLLAAGLLLVAGIVRMPVEQALTEDLRAQGMLSKPLDLETRKKVGQGFWAVSLGGLRTLVATVLNLRAFSYFEGQKWEQVADTYDTIVQLAPNSAFYWDTGHWHMAYNAAAHYQMDASLPEIRAQAEWRKWILRGTAFLEEATRQNPENALLWKQLGWLYSDPNKLVDYNKAAEAYGKAIEIGGTMPYVSRARLYALARTDEGIDQALPLLRELEQEPGGNVPTMKCLRFALEMRENPSRDAHLLALDVFGSTQRAYDHLGNYFLGVRDNFPMNGVAAELRRLESDLAIPAEESIFNEQ